MERIEDVMCDDITCENLHLASVVGMDDISPVCVRLWDGFPI